MPKTKTVKKTAVKKTVKKEKVIKKVTEPEITPEIPSIPASLPPVENIVSDAPVAGIKDYSHIRFAGAKIVKILPTKETKTHFNCQMSDGTTRHVPKELFE